MKSPPRALQLAVTEFALPAPRRGHIEMYSGFGPLPEVGAEIHAAIQAERLKDNPQCVPEKWVSHVFEREEYRITVSGRMDVYTPGMLPAIEEIKSAYHPERLLTALANSPDHPYRLQLLTYGYFHHQLTGVVPELRLNVICARTGESKTQDVALDLTVFEEWLTRRLDEVIAEDRMFEKLRKRRKWDPLESTCRHASLSIL